LCCDRAVATERVAADQVGREIAVLQEFRTRLTADVVTGQLDVREAAAGLPELDAADLAGIVGADVEDDLDTEAAEFLEDVDA
jgi:type I restriction enzyme, S subunit